MKRTIIFSLLVGALAFSVTSCMKVDNWDAPSSSFSGRIIDKYTGNPILASQGHGNVRIWEVSLHDQPDPIDIPLKQDGTFSNNKLFPATLDIFPQGAWWPGDTLRSVELGKSLVRDLEVTPYLVLSNFEVKVQHDAEEIIGTTTYTEGWYVYMSCVVDAPIKEGLPDIRRVRPFFSRTIWCGPGNDGSIGYLGNDRYLKIYDKQWSAIVADPTTELTSDGKLIVKLPKIDVKSGYTYWVRMGGNVRDTHENYNLTEIKQISIP